VSFLACLMGLRSDRSGKIRLERLNFRFHFQGELRIKTRDSTWVDRLGYIERQCTIILSNDGFFTSLQKLFVIRLRPDGDSTNKNSRNSCDVGEPFRPSRF